MESERPNARYDRVADSYQASAPDSFDGPVDLAFLGLVGKVEGLRLLDLACGHGRFSREFARRGARVVALDLSRNLVAKGQEAELKDPLGIQYVCADASSSDTLTAEAPFDFVTCSFGLSDIDDLDGALATVARVLRPDGRFAF